jgi:hypothetical protein
MWRAALRRFAILITIVTGVTALISLAIGGLAGSSVTRSLSVGFYAIGSFLVVCGFFVGNRGPVRPQREEGTFFFGPRIMRWATPEEREETINLSAIFVVMGFLLIIFGVLADTRYELY